MSQYPGKLASLAFLPNKRSHTSAICEASGEDKLVGTWIVVPLGIHARSCLSMHSNICDIITALIPCRAQLLMMDNAKIVILN